MCTVGSKQICQHLPGYSIDEMIKFGLDALDIAGRSNNSYIFDGLVRVDIFKANDGRLVVNELESLDAEYNCADVGKVAATDEFLELYWKGKIFDCISNLFE